MTAKHGATTGRRPALLAIASGKGGTGKSFLATSLAHALSLAGERVLLFDADLGLSNVSVYLGITQPMDIETVLSGERGTRDLAVPYLGGTAKRGGFDVLAGPSGSGVFANTEVGTVLRTVAALRMSAGYDRVILDLAAGVDDGVMRFALAADDTVLVVTPDPASLTDAYAFIKLYTRRAQAHGDTRTPFIVVNQVAHAAEALQVANAIAGSCRHFLGVAAPSLGFVRRDAKVVDATRRQSLLVPLHPKCPAALDIKALAERISGPQSATDTHKHAVRR